MTTARVLIPTYCPISLSGEGAPNLLPTGFFAGAQNDSRADAGTFLVNQYRAFQSICTPIPSSSIVHVELALGSKLPDLVLWIGSFEEHGLKSPFR